MHYLEKPLIFKQIGIAQSGVGADPRLGRRKKRSLRLFALNETVAEMELWRNVFTRLRTRLGLAGTLFWTKRNF